MKKLVLLLAVVFSVSLFSCGNKAAENTEATEGTEVVAEGTEVEVAEPNCCEANDSCCAAGDSCCAAAAEAEVVEAPAAE